jgi:hypothetical protein
MRHGGLVDEVYRDLVEQMEGIADARAPKLATVKGRDGGDRGNVLVQFDDEDAPRKVGLWRGKGQKYQKEDRVMVFPSDHGNKMVGFGVATGGSANADQAVDTEHLFDNAVDSKKLSTINGGAVTKDHIQKSQVGYFHLQDEVTKDIKAAQTKSDVQNIVNDKTSGFVKENSLPDFGKFATHDDLSAAVRRLEQEIKDIKGKKDKKNKV